MTTELNTELTTDPEPATEPTRHRLDVPGGTVYYEVRGSGPLLFVIAQPMTSGPFAPLADLLSSDHTVITYDPHGVGESTVDDPTSDVTPEIQAADLAAIVDALGAARADVFGSSGGAVTALAFAAHHPDRTGTVIAHEPPVADLLPDAVHVRRAVDGIADAYRAYGSGAGWGGFVSLVMHQGPVGPDGPAAASWPPAGEEGEEAGEKHVDEQQPSAPPEPSPKQQADDELFFLRMLKPFTRYRPEVDILRSGESRVVVAYGEASGPEIARRSAEALAERLGSEPVVFPGDHGGFMADPAGFATTIRKVLADT